jgi:hypothetical protein
LVKFQWLFASSATYVFHCLLALNLESGRFLQEVGVQMGAVRFLVSAVLLYPSSAAAIESIILLGVCVSRLALLHVTTPSFLRTRRRRRTYLLRAERRATATAACLDHEKYRQFTQSTVWPLWSGQYDLLFRRRLCFAFLALFKGVSRPAAQNVETPVEIGQVAVDLVFWVFWLCGGTWPFSATLLRVVGAG